MLASPNDLKIGMYRWRQWDFVQFKDRQAHFEDILALAAFLIREKGKAQRF